MIRFTVLPVPPGSLILAAGERGPSRVILTRRRGRAALALAKRELPEAAQDPKMLPGLQDELRSYFAGRHVTFHVRPDLSGLTPFQQTVLQACAKIPYGQTTSYANLAKRVGRPGAARAVGAVMARNPVPIIIPCHRVITAQGTLGGFSAEHGIALKRWLLEMEARGVGRQ
jgi:methylated-DNA-[protein]-cysteine S-methyltransferase